MDNDKILKDLNSEDRKKKLILIIGSIATILMIVSIILILCFGGNKKKENSKEVSGTVYDTTLTEDGTSDPENTDLDEEIGSVVEANILPSKEEWSNGIDVSKWQGKIDWKKVKNDGIEFAFIRIGYRGENGTIYKDANADYNIQQAQKNDVLVGVYFFSTATTEKEAKEEAEWTLQAIKGYKISYPVVYDCEGFDITGSRMNTLSVTERTDHAVTFLKTVTDAGYDAMFYGSLTQMKNDAEWEMDRIEKDYKVWVAQYPSTTYPTKETPDYDGAFHAWQYTNQGTVNGISGSVDMVVCYFTSSEAKAKDKNATPDTAKAPLTDEEKMYQAVNETVTAKDVTNLRTAATTKSKIVVALNNGETVTRIGIGTNGWSKLTYKGQTVYAISSYLTTDLTVKKTETPKQDIISGNTFTAKNDEVTAKDEVNLRALPTTDSEIIGKLVSGTFLTRTAVSDKGWSRLTYNGKTVYAVTSYLSNEVVKQPEETAPPAEPETPSDGFETVNEQVTAKIETNLRTQPSTDGSEVVYLLKNGEYVTRVGIHSNGWSKLEYNGQIVYAISSYLTK